MANEDTPTVTAEDIAKAALVLSGASEEKAEKAAPPFVKDEDKKEDDDSGDDKKDVEKSFSAAEVDAIVERAVSKAVDLVKAELFTSQAEVSKGFSALQDTVNQIAKDAKATLSFQSASVDVLKGFQAVTKGIDAKVDEIGAQPAGRRSVTAPVAVEKGAGVETPVVKAINLDPLMDWARAQNFEIGQRFELSGQAQNGNYSGIPRDVLKAMGVEA